MLLSLGPCKGKALATVIWKCNNNTNIIVTFETNCRNAKLGKGKELSNKTIEDLSLKNLAYIAVFHVTITQCNRSLNNYCYVRN